jgi:hypothetical protein
MGSPVTALDLFNTVAPFTLATELMDEMLGGLARPGRLDLSPLATFSPQVDMFERDGKLVIRATCLAWIWIISMSR